MITKENIIEFILQIEPEFLNYLNNYKRNYEDENNKLTVGEEFIQFSHFISEKFRIGFYPNAKKVFDAIEFLLENQESDEKVQTLVTTCFLENMQNQSSNGAFSPSLFVHLLGPKSREYCKAWDEFTGVKTPGLWGDEEPDYDRRFNVMSDAEAISIIKAIKNHEYRTEREEEEKIRLLSCIFPGILNLLFYDARKLTPEQILKEFKKNIPK